MKTGQLIRICLALAIIFAAGVWTGRLTSPRSPVTIAGSNGRAVSSDEVLARLTAEFGLDPRQRDAMRPLVDEIGNEMAPFLPGSLERRDILIRSVPRMKALLRPDQYPAVDRYVRETEKRLERIRRRRESQQRNTASESSVTNSSANSLPSDSPRNPPTNAVIDRR